MSLVKILLILFLLSKNKCLVFFFLQSSMFFLLSSFSNPHFLEQYLNSFISDVDILSSVSINDEVIGSECDPTDCVDYAGRGVAENHELAVDVLHLECVHDGVLQLHVAQQFPGGGLDEGEFAVCTPAELDLVGTVLADGVQPVPQVQLLHYCKAFCPDDGEFVVAACCQVQFVVVAHVALDVVHAEFVQFVPVAHVYRGEHAVERTHHLDVGVIIVNCTLSERSHIDFILEFPVFDLLDTEDLIFAPKEIALVFLVVPDCAGDLVELEFVFDFLINCVD